MSSVSMSDQGTNQPVWEGLKQAIATSSGFKCWQDERILQTTDESPNSDKQLDDKVISYLRETLETLAY
ncbi:MAG: hypothetical protein N5P05_001763 [Chroococcopsis gigantea SAG 12.99]|nr:hypothetical protein [Chroococcopsis gigantea SAG 12.99]